MLKHLGVVVALLFGMDAHAQEIEVDLELVLAVDISPSMEREEAFLQRNGYVLAFRDETVLRAIQSGAIGKIAVTYVEWASAGYQRVIVPWTLIEDAETAQAFSDALVTDKILGISSTSISGGLRFSAAQFGNNGYTGMRRTIDISGDGLNNDGLPVEPVRDEILSRGIIINGLPIMIRPGSGSRPANPDTLEMYYRECVIGGPGSFLIPVYNSSEFAEATRRKLILEIASNYLLPEYETVRIEPVTFMDNFVPFPFQQFVPDLARTEDISCFLRD